MALYKSSLQFVDIMLRLLEEEGLFENIYWRVKVVWIFLSFLGKDRVKKLFHLALFRGL